MQGAEVECYKVKTDYGFYWFKLSDIDNPRIHPLASQELLKELVEILRSVPQGLNNDPHQWKERINEVHEGWDILDLGSLVRDLSALKTTKKLNQIQNKALNNSKDRLLQEWAAGLEIDVSLIRSKLNTYLRESKALIQNEA